MDPAPRPGKLLITRRLLERGACASSRSWSGAGQPLGRPRKHQDPPPPARRRVGPGHRRFPHRPEAVRACSIRCWWSGEASLAGRPWPSCRRFPAAIITITASPCGWPAAGARGGHVHGATDEARLRRDSGTEFTSTTFHATMLQLLGFDHRKAHLPLQPAATSA